MTEKRSTQRKPKPRRTVDKNGIEWYPVGKGMTERRLWRVSSLENIEAMKRPPPAANSFEGEIAPAIGAAKRILERAGLPADPRGLYTIPQGDPIPMPTTLAESKELLSRPGVKEIGGLLPLVMARGYRERVDSEWYAAEILWTAGAVRGTMADGVREDGQLRQGIAWSVLSLAAELGELVGEAKALGHFSRTGKEGGGKEKRIWTGRLDFALLGRRRESCDTTHGSTDGSSRREEKMSTLCFF